MYKSKWWGYLLINKFNNRSIIHKSSTSKSTFTLIELLVVIAIIGILASILIPSLSKARIKTLKAVCLSNTSQIGKAMISNSTEHDGRIFWDDSTASPGWPHDIEVNNVNELGLPHEVYKCPLKPDYDYDSAWEISTSFRVAAYTYTYLRRLGSMHDGVLLGGAEWVDRLGAVEDPTETVMVVDTTFKVGSSFTNMSGYGRRTNHDGVSAKLDQNATFVDGHAKIRYWGSFQERYNIGFGSFWW